MSDAVTVMTKVRFKPFNVPNFASIQVGPRPKQEGISPLPSIPIAELDAEVLDALAGRWLDNLYAAVGRASPFAQCK